MAKKDGNPAFPTFPYDTDPGSEGMSLRDYFAARAPGEIPNWFKHVSPVKDFKPLPSWQELPLKEDQNQVRDWMSDGCYDLPDNLSWFQEAFVKYRAAYAVWEEADKIARYFQWRWYYADTMLQTQGA